MNATEGLLQLSRRPRWVLLAYALLSVLALLTCIDFQKGRLALRVDPSLERLLPAQDAERAIFDRVRKIFGEQDPLLLTVRFAQPVFTTANLARTQQLTDTLRAQPGVESVFSLATAPNLLASGDAIDVGSFTQQASQDPSQLGQLQRQLRDNPIYANGLLSKDGQETVFAISLQGMDEAAFRKANYPEALRRLAQQATGGEVHITGVQVVKRATTDALLKLFRTTIPLIGLVIIAVLGIAFRDVRLALAGAVTVGVSLLFTLAALRLLDMPLHMLTALTPVLVLTQGVCFAIHWVSDFLEESNVHSPIQRAHHALQQGALPLTLNAVTAIAGFLALLLNNLPAIRQFAVLTALGVAFALLLTLTLLPALVQVLGHSPSRIHTSVIYERLATRLAALAIRRRAWIIGVSATLMVGGLALSAGMKPNSDFVSGFPKDSAVRVDYEAINKGFGGANVLTVLIETYVPDALTAPDLAREVDQLSAWLRQQPEVGAVYGYPDLVKLLNRSLNDGNAAQFVIPADAAAIKQLLVFAGGDQVQRLLDAQFKTAQLVVRVKVDDATALSALSARVEARLRLLPKPLSARLTGSSLLATRTVEDLTSGQWATVALTAVLIWAVLSIIFTSPRSALIALLPNLTPVAIYFGLLSVTGIGLTPTTALIASIVLGISVDDTIHYMVRFNQEARERGSEEVAVKHALSAVLRPITLTMVALCSGFLVFTGAEMQSQVQFGLLAAVTLFLSWVSDITLTPALASLTRIVTLWDLLRLDLGRSPQHTIPLLSGLSLRQARTFALLSDLETRPQGSLLISEGDYARDIYVVIDGQLEAFVDRDGSRKPLSRMSRGAVMGEAGYFGQRRTASVEALTEVRLLRFDSQDLERLRLRHPRIAATVFRNLNRIQAERISRMTSLIK